MIKSYFRNKAKKKIINTIFIIIRPLIVPLIILLIFITLVSSITDVLYIVFDNDDKVDIKKELAYYNTEYEEGKDKEEVKVFFQSVWDFTTKIFGDGGMSDETDWPVERTLCNK